MRTLKLTVNDIQYQALLNFLKTLDSAKVEENDVFNLSETQRAILDERKTKHLNGESKSISWEEVKRRARSAK